MRKAKTAKGSTNVQEFRKQFFAKSFDTREALKEYMIWRATQTMPQPPHIPKAEECIATTQRTNFTHKTDIANITSLLDLPASPYIPLGSFKGVLYRLIPDTGGLVETKAPSDTKHYLLLGYQPQRRATNDRYPALPKV
jgi:hypothetical protein